MLTTCMAPWWGIEQPSLIASEHRRPLSVDSLHFVRRIWWHVGRLGAMIAVPIRLDPTEGYAEHPRLAGTPRADGNRRIIQNLPARLRMFVVCKHPVWFRLRRLRVGKGACCS